MLMDTRLVSTNKFDHTRTENISLGLHDVQADVGVISTTSRVFQNGLLCPPFSVSSLFFSTANVPETLIRGSHPSNEPRLYGDRWQNSRQLPRSTPQPRGNEASLWRIDFVEVLDVFLLESAVITGIFYRQEEDIYTADVLDDRGGSLAPRRWRDLFPISRGEMIHGRSSRTTIL